MIDVPGRVACVCAIVLAAVLDAIYTAARTLRAGRLIEKRPQP